MNISKKHPDNGYSQDVLQKKPELANRILLLFTLEGMLITIVNNLVGNNNNIFATRLGASDLQLSLLTTVPQLVGLAVLIPGGLLTDRLKNKRSMVMVSLLVLMMFYALIGCVPMLPANRFVVFLILLATASTNDGKLRLHQMYFWIGAALLLIQVFVLKQIKGSRNTSAAPRDLVFYRSGELS